MSTGEGMVSVQGERMALCAQEKGWAMCTVEGCSMCTGETGDGLYVCTGEDMVCGYQRGVVCVHEMEWYVCTIKGMLYVQGR